MENEEENSDYFVLKFCYVVGGGEMVRLVFGSRCGVRKCLSFPVYAGEKFNGSHKRHILVKWGAL